MNLTTPPPTHGVCSCCRTPLMPPGLHLGCRMLPGGCWPQPKLVTHWRKVMRGLGQVGPRRRVDPRMYFVDRSPRIVAFAAQWQQGVAAANGSA